jgi:hypothetical protein
MEIIEYLQLLVKGLNIIYRMNFIVYPLNGYKIIDPSTGAKIDLDNLPSRISLGNLDIVLPCFDYEKEYVKKLNDFIANNYTKTSFNKDYLAFAKSLKNNNTKRRAFL